MSGELAPLNSRGTLFFISYKPLSYGRLHKARLIVQVLPMCQVKDSRQEGLGLILRLSNDHCTFSNMYRVHYYGEHLKSLPLSLPLPIQCQLSEWCYEIVGQPPQYSPPTDTPARVQHRATPPLLLTQTRKNFIRENIKLSTCRQPVH